MWRKYDLYATMFAIVGLIVMIVNYEIDVWFFGIQTFEEPDGDMREKAMTCDRYLSIHTSFFRWVIALTSMAALACLLIRHHYKIQWLNKFFTTI